MPHCLIGLGSNLGNRREIIEEALAKLRRLPGIQVLGVSSFRETAPIGGPADQPPYLNAAALIDSSLQPRDLLALLQQIETEAGRRRKETWGPRTLDLDLLLYGELVLSTPTLTLPHPRMAWRRFVLEPAAEVAGQMRHPLIGWTVAGLLEHLNTALPYVAVAGPIAAGKTHLARLLCDKTSARLISEAIDEQSLEIFYADPAGHAWTMELEFLHKRTDLLAVDSAAWSERRPAVSDFWFDQSPAFAQAWLSESQRPAFFERWQEARQNVVQPKLIVLLDAPAETLMDRIRRRGRRGEEFLSPEKIARIRQSIIDQASQPGLGPVLKISGADIRSALTETLAAMQAMQ
ncbi:MAG: 2-amino-4-hydroxy-6-hydroxymethyldihydropteridine diphosphokinase [Thermoguttaceae bacterium]|jgi:2-amino-4-hydroxy-6-hydroxymethyldihydropteridine diphosphokinase